MTYGGEVTTRQLATSRWVAVCDGCGTMSTEEETSASRVLLGLPPQGWGRRRPGVSDYCPSCLRGPAVAE